MCLQVLIHLNTLTYHNMDRLKIVVPGDAPQQIQGSHHLKRLEPYGDVVIYKDRPDTDVEKICRAKDADILINSRGMVKWYADVLKQLPKLKLISLCSIGTDMIDLETAKQQGIVVCNQPGRTAPVVAEHSFGLMFGLAKRTAYLTQSLKSGIWPRMDNIYLQGKTLGIIGTGHIGSEMARLANAIGMNVIAWTYNPTTEKENKLGIRYVQLENLLKMSDVVSLHIKLTDDSYHLIGERELAMMKSNALLINVARGNIIETDALVEALNNENIGGAAIDVFDQEPIPKNHPLLSCEQVILSPHCADMTPEGVDLLNEGAVDNIIAYLQGKPKNVVE